MVIFSFRVVWARASRASVGVHAALQPKLADHPRHHRLVAILSDAHLDLVLKVDAFDELQKAVHEVLARLLAVGDDVDAGVLLLLQDEQRRVALGAREVFALEAPRRPEAVRLGEPEGLWQRAGDGGGKERHRRHFWHGFSAMSRGGAQPSPLVRRGLGEGRQRRVGRRTPPQPIPTRGRGACC